jgi:hypothetical protein
MTIRICIHVKIQCPQTVRGLVRSTAIGKVSFAGFNPTFKIRGTAVVLHPLEIVSIPLDQLGEMVGSLRKYRVGAISAANRISMSATVQTLSVGDG